MMLSGSGTGRSRAGRGRAARARPVAAQLALALGPGGAARPLGPQLDGLHDHVDEQADRAGADGLDDRVGDADADLGGGRAEPVDKELAQPRGVVDDGHQRGEVEAGAARGEVDEPQGAAEDHAESVSAEVDGLAQERLAIAGVVGDGLGEREVVQAEPQLDGVDDPREAVGGPYAGVVVDDRAADEAVDPHALDAAEALEGGLDGVGEPLEVGLVERAQLDVRPHAVGPGPPVAMTEQVDRGAQPRGRAQRRDRGEAIEQAHVQRVSRTGAGAGENRRAAGCVPRGQAASAAASRFRRARGRLGGAEPADSSEAGGGRGSSHDVPRDMYSWTCPRSSRWTSGHAPADSSRGRVSSRLCSALLCSRPVERSKRRPGMSRA
ncbi:hypothetical protein [Nannocystis pusilla]|uniref:hypothetical protein n=1 Tax=Nannocystis pusilla TaxID=889268 RepID=UPI003B7A444E